MFALKNFHIVSTVHPLMRSDQLKVFIFSPFTLACRCLFERLHNWRHSILLTIFCHLKRVFEEIFRIFQNQKTSKYQIYSTSKTLLWPFGNFSVLGNRYNVHFSVLVFIFQNKQNMSPKKLALNMTGETHKANLRLWIHCEIECSYSFVNLKEQPSNQRASCVTLNLK